MAQKASLTEERGHVKSKSAMSKSNQPGLAGALSDVLAGGIADTSVEAESVWPVEEPDPASGFDTSPRRRRTTLAPVTAKMTTPEPKVIIKTVTVTAAPAEAKPAKACEDSPNTECKECMDCHKMITDIMDGMKCPPAKDCTQIAAANSNAAYASAAAAMAKAAELPSPEAVAASEIVKQAMKAAGDARDYAQRAYARSTEAKWSVSSLREDLWKAAAARAAELRRVRVVPPSVPNVF